MGSAPSFGKTWARRLETERQSETWAREKQDIITVPGLTPRSEAILKALDKLGSDEKQTFLAQMTDTPEGRQALSEAETITRALKQRFGTADILKLEKMDLRIAKDQSENIERLKDIARLAERAHRAELTQRHELKQGLRKGMGL